MELSWIPREQNVEADELSNFLTHRFSPENEVDVTKLLADMPIFKMSYDLGKGMYDDIKQVKEDASKKKKEERKRSPSRPKEERHRKRGRSPKLKEREPW